MKKILLPFIALVMGMTAYAQQSPTVDRSSLPEPPTGYVNGLFTVNEQGTQVYFSQGNLQYAEGQWRFAEHQYDILGDNGQGSADESVSRDLFGWGTSGQAHGATSYQPWSVSRADAEYYAYGDASSNLFDGDGSADWGANGIANGGGMAGLWRVPTREEWDYVLNTRSTESGVRYAKAKVNGVCGVVLLPDNWDESYYALNNANERTVRYKSNIITESDWTTSLEAHGAVFLPSAGYRFGEKLYYPGKRGSYASATASGGFHVWNVSFDDANMYAGQSSTRRGNGLSVRLVATSTALWFTEVTTGEVTDITSNSATVSYTVTTDGGTVLTATGVCWTTDPNAEPTVDGDHTEEGASSGDFTSELTGLERNTTYYVRAYATDGMGDTMYGEVVEFATLAELPSVTTGEVTDIAITTATANGEVTDDGGAPIEECGFCWVTDPTTAPTIDDDHAAITTPEVGSFMMDITGLTQNTTYYLCAYATNVVGTVYGEVVEFTTLRQPWDVTATAEPAEGGTVTGAGTYYQDDECTLTATANEGYDFVNWTEGGEEVSTEAEYAFEVTEAHDLVAHFELNKPEGTINGKFSVNAAGDLVYFSQGNLQYQASTNTWQFAEHQWDYVGGANANASANSSGWMDLFGWGTSGYNHGAVCYQPWSTSTTNSDYYAYGSGSYNLFDQTGKADWGYNAISNGGNKENDGWRTLTQEEWDYLFNTRNPNGTRYAKANVNGVNGVILLPDDWREDYYSLSDPNTSSANYNVNTISLVDWAILELYGAVFLPAAGCRVETLVNFSGSHGHYWSASSNANSAYIVHFVEDNLNIPNNYYKSAGRSVRLVRSIYSFTISASANPLEGGEVSGAGTYDSGESCTLTATPAEGYTFVNWTEGVDDTGAPRVVSTNAEYTFRVTSSRTLVANFELIPIPEGALNGKFSVNADGDQIFFSQGNLQYIGSAATPYWKFADHQWDCLGDNGQGSDSQTVDRDLFGWGTSGYDHGAVCYQPWSTSQTNSDYYVYNNRYSELYSSTGKADWGYNAISNGGNQENSGWRTLTKDEWAYIFDGRNTASGKRFAMGNVNGVDGLILLPDNWDASTYPLNKTNDAYGGFHANTISATVWTTVLEANGAVFLPKTVGREGTTITTNCNYWSSTHSDGNYAYSVYLGSNYFDFGNCVNNRSIGNVVRLVRSAQDNSYTITATANPLEGGEVSGAGTYDSGESCTLTATPAEGYTFVNWTEDDKVVSTDATYTFEVTASRTLVANFELAPTSPEGALNGKFSVNADGMQVLFSQGNLQYIGSASTPYWKFAEHQWDTLGKSTSQNTNVTNVDRDLFGWGTSGWDNGNTYYQPWSTNYEGYDDNPSYGYGPTDGTNYEYDLTGAYGYSDWGHNPISNGGNTADQWRTLTQPEWDYVFNTRTTTSGIRYAKAKVSGVNGVVLLPDDWSAEYFTLSSTNTNNADFSSNTITADDWAGSLESHGAVFLPAAGYRDGTSVINVGLSGYYWSASYDDSVYAWYVYFNDADLSTDVSTYRDVGQSVRLVRFLQDFSFTVSAMADPSEGGAVSGGGTYEDGASCTLTATPAEGYIFVNWTENVTGANPKLFSTSATVTFPVHANLNLVANFEAVPEGAINGQFSVNANGTQVLFSQGNLQYIGSASTPYWKFADHQWDCLGDNGQGSDSQTVDRDLFGWGTSGYDHGAVCYQPWSTSESNSDYYVYNNRYSELYSSTGKADWGYNAISNGGNQENSGWRTLTRNEWAYIFDGRNTASGKRFAMGNVNGVDGLILLPDNWDASTYPLNKTNDAYGGFHANTISATVWTTVLEANGAVFLPKTVGREGTTITNNCNYWSSTHSDGNYAYSVYLGSNYFDFGNCVNNRSIGNAVRLVRSIQ